MTSGTLIALTALAAWVWGGDFLHAPMWFRVPAQALIATVLFLAVLHDWRDGSDRGSSS